MKKYDLLFSMFISFIVTVILVFILTPKEEVVYECEIKSQYEIYNVEDVTDIKFEDEIVGNDTLTFYIGNDKVIIVEPEISYVCEE